MELFHWFCFWTLIPLSRHWAWLLRGYWRYRNMIDWLIDWKKLIVHLDKCVQCKVHCWLGEGSEVCNTIGYLTSWCKSLRKWLCLQIFSILMLFSHLFPYYRYLMLSVFLSTWKKLTCANCSASIFTPVLIWIRSSCLTYGAETWSREEACCSPTKHGEMLLLTRRGERDNKIAGVIDIIEKVKWWKDSGQDISQNEEHQVGENNINGHPEMEND